MFTEKNLSESYEENHLRQAPINQQCNLSYRIYCCTRKLQETLTWSPKMVPVAPPPTWTALRDVYPSLNCPRRKNQELKICRRWQKRNSVDMITDCGGLWEWTWWFHPSVSLLLLCWAGQDPRWALYTSFFRLSNSFLSHFWCLHWCNVLWSCLRGSCGGGRGTRGACRWAATLCTTTTRWAEWYLSGWMFHGKVTFLP